MKRSLILLLILASFGSFNFLNAQTKVVKLSIDQTGVESCINTIVAEVTDNTISLYPNPNDGNFTLKIDPSISNQPMKIEILDNTGKIIFHDEKIDPEELSDLKICLENVVSGIYFLKAYSKDEIFKQSIVIKK